jgi:hypothetical protein
LACLLAKISGSEYSVQTDHVHLIAEAEHRRALSSGVRGLAIRLARAVYRSAVEAASGMADTTRGP